MYYFLIKETNVIGLSQCPCQSEGCICVEVTEEQYNLAQEKGNNYFVYENDEIIINPNYEQEEQQKERERLDDLTLTRGDVFAGLIQARMIDETVLAQMVEQMPETTPEEKMAKMLSKNALSNALNFHRNHPMVNTIGTQLGVSQENLDLFFETNDYHYLQEQEPVEE